MTDGPVESVDWSNQLEARVVDDSDEAGPRAFGFAIQSDLAEHYHFGDLIYLAAMGRCPTDSESEDFQTSLFFAAGITVASAPTHSGILGRTMGAQAHGVVATISTVLAQEAKHVLDTYKPLLQAEQGSAQLLKGHRCIAPADEAAKTRLRARLNSHHPLLETDISLVGAVLATWWQCGLTSDEQLVTAWVMARLPLAVAEAAARNRLDFLGYPTQLPPYEYVADDST